MKKMASKSGSFGKQKEEPKKPVQEESAEKKSKIAYMRMATKNKAGKWEKAEFPVLGFFLNLDAPNEHLPSGNVSFGTTALEDIYIPKGAILTINLHHYHAAIGIKTSVDEDSQVIVEAAEEE